MKKTIFFKRFASLFEQRNQKLPAIFLRSFNIDLSEIKIESAKEEIREIRVDDIYIRVFYLKSLSNSYYFYEDLYMLVKLQIPFVYKLSLVNEEKTSIISNLQKIKANYLSSSIEKSRKNKLVHESEKQELQNVEKMISSLVYDKLKPVSVSGLIFIPSLGKKKLIKKGDYLSQSLSNRGFEFKTLSFDQKKGLMDFFVPSLKFHLNNSLLTTTEILPSLFPVLTIQTIEKQGIFFGVNLYNRSMTFINILESRNKNLNIFGVSGSGKSTLSKVLAYRLWLTGIRVIIIDPEGEYSSLLEEVKGISVRIDEVIGINIFKILDNFNLSDIERVNFYKTIICLFLDSNSSKYSTDLDISLYKFINLKNKSFKALIKIVSNKKLKEELKVFTEGSLKNKFDRGESISIEKDFIVFDLSKIESLKIRNAFFYILNFFVFANIRTNSRLKTILFIDEAHILLENENTSYFYKNLVKRARKYNSGVVSITQNIEDFIDDKYNVGSAILTNSDGTCILRQSKYSVEKLSKVLDLSINDKETITSLQTGVYYFVRESQKHLIQNIVLESERGICKL